MTHRSKRRSAPRPTAVGGALDRVLGELPKTNPLRRANLAWARLAGRLGRHSRILSGDPDKGYQIAVPDDGWADALAPHLKTLRRRLAEALGRRIGPLTLVVRPRDFEDEDLGASPRPAASSAHAPRSASEDDLARVAAWGVDAPELQAAIARAMGAARDAAPGDDDDPVP